MDDFKTDYLGNKPEFINELAELWYKEWFSEAKDFPVSNLVENFHKRLNKGQMPFILIAYKDNLLLGSAALSEFDLKKREDLSPWLCGVLVKPEFRGKGIASRLVGEAVEITKELGFNKMFLHTEKAHGLYEKLGWKHLEHTINDQNEESDIYYFLLK